MDSWLTSWSNESLVPSKQRTKVRSLESPRGIQTRSCLLGGSQAKHMLGTGVKVLPPTGLKAEPARGVAGILGDSMRVGRDGAYAYKPPGRVAALVTSTQALKSRSLNMRILTSSWTSVEPTTAETGGPARLTQSPFPPKADTGQRRNSPLKRQRPHVQAQV